LFSFMFWWASSSTSAFAPAATAASAPAIRSAEIQAGLSIASIRGSSPTSAAVWTAGSTRSGPFSVPP